MGLTDHHKIGENLVCGLKLILQDAERSREDSPSQDFVELGSESKDGPELLKVKAD